MKRRTWFAGLLTLTLALAARAQEPAEKIKGEPIYLRDYGSDDIGYLVVPEQMPRAGVVMVPDGHGLDEWMKITADVVAQKGCLVLALDLYNLKPEANEQAARAREAELLEANVLRSLKTAVNFFHQSPRFRMDKVYVVGFGPMSRHVVAFAAQKNMPFNGAVLVNPTTVPAAADLRRLRYPALFQLSSRSPVAVELLEQLVGESGARDLVEVKTSPALRLNTRRLDEEQWKQIADFMRRNSTEERRKSLLQRIFE